MKYLIFLLIVFAVGLRVCAQSQELEQLRLDLEKLAQFKLMLSEMKSGYQTLAKGYNAVLDAGKGNFNLHKNYLDGLLEVNPQLKNDPTVKRINRTQSEVAAELKELLTKLRDSPAFTASEIIEVAAEGNAILDEMNDDTQLLGSVLTPGSMRMSDGERAAVVARIAQSMDNAAQKMKTLKDSSLKARLLRLQDQRDRDAIKRLHQ